jgi:hypothetical protein
MADATAPYCSSTDVKVLLMFFQEIGAADFPVAGNPPLKSQIDTLIAQTASRIDQTYASVGYVIPFSAKAGETWPTYQDGFLSYFNAVGVAAMFASPASSPQIADMRASRRDRSQYGSEWEDLLEGIRSIGRREEGSALSLIRAQTRVGTAAEWMLATPYPPLSDFLEGYQSPENTDLMREFTGRYREYFKFIKSQELSPEIDPLSVEHLWWWHFRLGYTFDA